MDRQIYVFLYQNLNKYSALSSFFNISNLCISILEFKWKKKKDNEGYKDNLCISILEFKQR